MNASTALMSVQIHRLNIKKLLNFCLGYVVNPLSFASSRWTEFREHAL